MRKERASQEAQDPSYQLSARGVVKMRHFARRPPDVLDVLVQLFVLAPEWLSGPHLRRIPVAGVGLN
jgi:hypothetical protein